MKYNVDDIKLISLFESITRSNVKDVFMLGQPLFVVSEGQLGKALGRNKANLFRIEKMLNKKIRIVEFSSNLLQFVVNVIAPLKVVDIKEEDGVVLLTAADSKTRGLLIGRQAQNLRNTERIVKKYFDVKEIRVV